MAGELSKNDPFSWLGRTKFGGAGASKASDRVSVSKHSRGKPTTKSKGEAPTYSGGPEGKPNPAMKGQGTVPSTRAPMKTEREPGAATAQARKKSGSKGGATSTAKSAKANAVHEAGE